MAFLYVACAIAVWTLLAGLVCAFTRGAAEAGGSSAGAGEKGLDRVSERGYFGIGIVGSKTPLNVGTLWRSAGNFGAAFIFTAGKRYPKQASDTISAYKHIPLFEVANVDELFESVVPHDCVPVAVELTDDSRALPEYTHPERAIYMLGAEDNGLTKQALSRCRDVVAIPSERCLNVAVAGSVVMYDRMCKAAS